MKQKEELYKLDENCVYHICVVYIDSLGIWEMFCIMVNAIDTYVMELHTVGLAGSFAESKQCLMTFLKSHGLGDWTIG